MSSRYQLEYSSITGVSSAVIFKLALQKHHTLASTCPGQVPMHLHIFQARPISDSLHKQRLRLKQHAGMVQNPTAVELLQNLWEDFPDEVNSYFRAV